MSLEDITTHLKSERVPIVRTRRVVDQRPRPPDERPRVLRGLRRLNRRRRWEQVSAAAALRRRFRRRRR